MAPTSGSNMLGFKCVGLQFSAESRGVHQLLWKPHSVRSHTQLKPPDRTLFIVNVPPYCTKEAFQRLFSEYGKVQEVYFHKKPTAGPPLQPRYSHFSVVAPVTGFKVAYVVFSHASAVKKAMAVPADTILTVSTPDAPVLTGVSKWREEYNRGLVRLRELKEEASQVVQDYDREEAERSARAKQEPDDEGWVTVTTQKKKKPHLEKIDELKPKKNKKKKKKRELVNFYCFQQRQAKMDHLADLRKKFEEDKKRISQMRASRKFRPY